jgi:hypothetical protein
VSPILSKYPPIRHASQIPRRGGARSVAVSTTHPANVAAAAAKKAAGGGKTHPANVAAAAAKKTAGGGNAIAVSTRESPPRASKIAAIAQIQAERRRKRRRRSQRCGPRGGGGWEGRKAGNDDDDDDRRARIRAHGRIQQGGVRSNHEAVHGGQALRASCGGAY